MKLKQVHTHLGEFTINVQGKERTGQIVVSGFYANKYAPEYKEFYFYDNANDTVFAKYGTQAAWIRLP